MSDDEAVWKAAAGFLRHHDPRLARGLKELMEQVVDQPARGRLVAVLSDMPEESLVEKDILLRSMSDEGGNFFVRSFDAKEFEGYSFWAEPRVSYLNVSANSAKPTWTRAIRGIVLLEDIGSPAARGIVESMAGGHPDAEPTRVAREFIAKRSASR